MIHHLKVQVRSGAITGMPHPGKLLACHHFIAWRDPDRAGLCMGIDCIPLTSLDDDVIASQLLKGIFLLRVERPGILQKDGEISAGVDRIPLWPAVFCLDYDPRAGRKDRPAPAVAVLQGRAEDEIVKRTRPVKCQKSAR